jgi:hypothetical protein
MEKVKHWIRGFRRPPIVEGAGACEMDPLVALAHRNITWSPLCRLPDEILLEIMERLDFASLYTLRNVSRVFLRLFGAMCFQQYRYGQLPSYIWPTPMPAILNSRFLVLRSWIQRGKYCATCLVSRDARERGGMVSAFEMAYLHCSGCKLDHQAHLFSAAQRRAPPQERICIGREGYVRLCEHKTIGWDDIQQRLAGWSHLPREIKCKDRSHKIGRRKTSSVYATPVARFNSRCTELSFFKWTHVSFTTIQRPLTAEDVRQRLREIQQVSPCPWYPDEDCTSLSPMRCLEPNTCSCLVYTGAKSFDW